jgi:anti-sigma B factor antagonist
MSLDQVVVDVDQDLLDFANTDTWRSSLLRISVSWMGDIAIMVLAGEVDLSTASLMQEHLEEILPDLRSDLVVDLGLVTFLGSTGMSFLVLAHRQLQVQGSRLVVFAPTPRIRSLFEICDLNSVLVIVPDNSDEN